MIAKKTFYFDTDFRVEVPSNGVHGNTAMAQINSEYAIQEAVHKNPRLWKFCFPSFIFSAGESNYTQDRIVGDTNDMQEFRDNKRDYIVRAYVTNGNERINILSYTTYDIVRVELCKKDTPVGNSFKGKSDNPPPEPMNGKAQQIQNIVNEFLAMNPPPVNEVQKILTAFQEKVMPQIQSGAAKGQIDLQIAPAFPYQGNRQPPESFNIDTFFNLPKDRQFDTIYRLTCGRENVTDPNPNDAKIVRALKAFSIKIFGEEKKKQPPAAPANNGDDLPQEPPKQ